MSHWRCNSLLSHIQLDKRPLEGPLLLIKPVLSLLIAVAGFIIDFTFRDIRRQSNLVTYRFAWLAACMGDVGFALKWCGFSLIACRGITIVSFAVYVTSMLCYVHYRLKKVSHSPPLPLRVVIIVAIPVVACMIVVLTYLVNHNDTVVCVGLCMYALLEWVTTYLSILLCFKSKDRDCYNAKDVLMAVGLVVFCVSDYFVFIAFQMFSPWLQVAVWITYIPALWLTMYAGCVTSKDDAGDADALLH